MDHIQKYNEWLNTDSFDEGTKKALKAMSNNEQEIKDSFYKDLEFGTGGLRGIIGVRHK